MKSDVRLPLLLGAIWIVLMGARVPGWVRGRARRKRRTGPAAPADEDRGVRVGAG